MSYRKVDKFAFVWQNLLFEYIPYTRRKVEPALAAFTSNEEQCLARTVFNGAPAPGNCLFRLTDKSANQVRMYQALRSSFVRGSPAQQHPT